MTALALGAILVWGVLVGLDLTSAPQMGISRPLVAGAVAGVILGDLPSGLMAGVVLELFALDFLPVGAARYPDYGLGAIASATVMSRAPAVVSLGLATFVGLVIAYLGGQTVHLVRMLNTRAVVRNAVSLDEGSQLAINGLHLTGIFRDGARSLLVTAVGLALAAAARTYVDLSVRAAMITTVVALGAALAASVGGAINVAGRRPGLVRYVLGLVVGIIWIAAR